MGIIFLIAFLIFFKNSKPDTRNSDFFKYVVFGTIALSVVSSVIEPFAGFGILALIIWGISKLLKKRKNKTREKKYSHGENARDYNKNYYYTREQQEQDALPSKPKKRRRIVEEFNEKYSLCLTPAQISSIVNASYMSEIWRNEIYAMSRKYTVVYEWFNDSMAWLRAYLYVFKVQDVISDINEQERICVYAFNEIFSYADSLGQMPLSMKIKYINDKYMTNFDDATYMIAYRFLEQRGIKHNESNPDIVNKDAEVDELLKKYKGKKGV